MGEDEGVQPSFKIDWTKNDSATYTVKGTYEDVFKFFEKRVAVVGFAQFGQDGQHDRAATEFGQLVRQRRGDFSHVSSIVCGTYYGKSETS